MNSMTRDEARRYCGQDHNLLRVSEDDEVYYDVPDEVFFIVDTPPEFRKIAILAHDIIQCVRDGDFLGGLVWLHIWYVGPDSVMKAGWRVLEDMRRAHGDVRTLDIAPAQLFREDESQQLQVFLMQVMGNGWSGYFVPANADFILQFRTSDRFFCYARSEKKLDELYSGLKGWKPTKEDSMRVVSEPS